MTKPRVCLENQQALYDFYQDRHISQRVARSAHAVSSVLFRPHIAYEGSTEGDLIDHFSNDGLVILVANHLRAIDPFAIASAAQKQPALMPLRGSIVIPAKAELYRFGLSRAVLDNFVAYPTFRRSDEAKSSLPPLEAKAQRALATQRIIDICIANADRGINVAIFPQGTRIKDDPHFETSLRTGVVRIASGLAMPERFKFMPVGVHYEPAKHKMVNPSLFIGSIFPISPNKETIISDVKAALRTSVAQARTMPRTAANRR